jgi:hypothetical protein
VACNIFWVGKKNYIFTAMDGEAQRFMFLLYFRLFVESLLLYVHINCSLVHTSFHSCSLYFVHSHIQTHKIVGENDRVLTASVEEEIERCMLGLLFHIVLFCISFIVCICVHLVYCM